MLDDGWRVRKDIGQAMVTNHIQSLASIILLMKHSGSMFCTYQKPVKPDKAWGEKPMSTPQIAEDVHLPGGKATSDCDCLL